MDDRQQHCDVVPLPARVRYASCLGCLAEWGYHLTAVCVALRKGDEAVGGSLEEGREGRGDGREEGKAGGQECEEGQAIRKEGAEHKAEGSLVVHKDVGVS